MVLWFEARNSRNACSVNNGRCASPAKLGAGGDSSGVSLDYGVTT